MHKYHFGTGLLKQESWNVLKKLIDVQFNKADEDIPTKQFLLAIVELLESSQIYLLPVSSENDVLTPFKGKHAGYIDGDYVYLFPSITYGAVQEFFKIQNQVFSYSKGRIFKLLADEELIDVEYSGNVRNTSKQKRINGKKGRYLTISKNKLFSE